ncbi:UNVERIFIED_CONTAM: hypothetical protein GTU68_066709, partial [Idotea baltica]|nr:hypothetical protein [Idotea baltica]
MGREISTSSPGMITSSVLGTGLPPPLALSANKGVNMLPINEPILVNPAQPQTELVDGFYVWNEGVLCSDQLCPHIGHRHFHCAHPRCLYVTISAENLSIHEHFHENTQILDGFMSFDRNINCRMGSCQSNTVSKHFHCTKCGFSFVRYQVMEAHAEKHHQQEENTSTHSLGPLSPIYLQKPRPDSPMETPANNSLGSSVEGSDTPLKSQPLIPVVKSSGIFYPLSPFPIASQGTTRTTTSTTNSQPGALVTPIPPSSRPSVLPTFTLPVSGCLSITATRRSPGLPPSYSPLPQERMDQDESEEPKKKINSEMGVESPEHSNDQSHAGDGSAPRTLMSPVHERNPPSSLIPDYANSNHHLQYGQEISCGRPFCKLKKKEHFHC